MRFYDSITTDGKLVLHQTLYELTFSTKRLTAHPNSLLAASVCVLREGSHKSHGSGSQGMVSCLVWQFPTW